VGGAIQKNQAQRGGQTTKWFRNTALDETVNTPKMTVTYKSLLHRNISCQQQELALYCSGDQIQKNEMGRAGGLYGGQNRCI